MMMASVNFFLHLLSTTRGEEDVALERSLLESGVGGASCTAAAELPLIDLDAEGAAEAMWSAASSLGFFTVRHGLRLEDIFGVAEEFFEYDRETKEALSPYSASLNAGYEYMRQTRPSTGLADVKESIQITTRESSMEGRWPGTKFEAVVRAFASEANELAKKIMASLEGKLANLQQGTLASAHTIWTEDSQCTLRLLRYPPLLEDKDLPEGSMRAGAHTDWGCVTLLFQLPGNEGLECAQNPRRNDTGTSWMKVDPVEGHVAVNVGDMLAKWSEGKLLSNLHRVRMPQTDDERRRARYSIAWFAQADKHQSITTSTPTGGTTTISAGDYILSRLKSNYATSESSEESS
mmetsp:Transcript_31453/g.101039  ORF Transcript_31453/g.101039 Transcript_31453/m.101039 type:complete len:349 (-) Transcript_31453:54-1100(-)